MTAGETFLYILRRTGLILGALLLMTVLLAAMPGHRAPNVGITQGAQESPSASSREMADMPGLEMDDAKLNRKPAGQRMTGVHSVPRDLKMTTTP